MKLKLLKYLRCLGCLSTLDLKDIGAATADSGDSPEDVMEGRLVCTRCSATYTVSGGVPRMYISSSPDATRPRTAASFGYLWSQSIPGAEVYDQLSCHFQQIERPLLGLLLGQPQDLHRRLGQVSEHIHVWKQVELLKDHADLSPDLP